MELDIARAILIEAKRGNFYRKEIPESKGEIVNDAIYYAEEAQKAWDEGWGRKEESVRAILSLLNLAQDESENDNSTFGKEEPLGERFSSSERIGIDTQFASENGGGGQTATVPHILVALAEENNLAIPAELQAPAPEMPRDITNLTDIQVRKLYSEFNALLNLAKWKLAIETSDLNDATHLRDDAYRNEYVSIPRIDEETGKSKTATLIDMEVKTSKIYQKYDKLVQKHTQSVTGLKALMDIYSSNVDRLSREMTFRQFEWEKSK